MVKNKLSGSQPVGIEVIFYTDPLCCWSWAMEKEWLKIVAEAAGTVKVEYKMGGLIPSWQHFLDNGHSISRPAQMGPEWMHAAHVSGTKINSQIWVTDPPASSYPACIAVKCAQLQSDILGQVYLHMLREAVMVDMKNIAKTNVLLELAAQCGAVNESFDNRSFSKELLGGNGKRAFRKDLQDAKYMGINRFPTLVIKSQLHGAVILTGYQSAESLRRALGRMTA